jgi:hypothetical protein
MKYTISVLIMLGVVYAAALASHSLLSRAEPALRGVDRAPIELQISSMSAYDSGKPKADLH